MIGEESPRIVVGVDGSEPSKEALRWAVRQAELVGGSVDAVTVWQNPSTCYGYGWVPQVDVEHLQHLAQTSLAKAVAEVVSTETAVPVRQHVRVGDPTTKVLQAADGAALLVVGNRGHGAFAGALLGSVSYRCAHHASCPVVVVHGSA